MDLEPLDSDALLRMAGRLARFGGWSVDLRSGEVHWSDEVYAIHEVPPGTPITVETGLRYFTPESAPVIQDGLNRCIEDGGPYDMEADIVTSKGRRRWVRTVGEPVRNANGDVIAVHGAFQDISAQREGEGRVRELEERQTHTLDNLPDGFMVLDHGWRFQYLNDAAARTFQRETEDLRGKVVWEEYPAAAESGFRERYEKVAREARPIQFEEFYEPWGRWYFEHAYPVDGGIAVYFRDITEERAVRERLQQSEAIFEQLTRNVEGVFWIASADYRRVEYVSPAYAQLWGHPPEDLYRDPFRWLDPMPPEDRTKVEEALASGAPPGFDLEYRIRRPDGQIRWIWDRTFPVWDEDGEVRRVVGVAQDITAKKELDEQLHHGQRLEVVGELAGGVAHDFNNLLTVIQATAEVLIEDLPEDSPLQEPAQEIREQTDRGARLTRQLLAYSRRQVLEECVLDMGEAVAEVLPMIRRVIPERIEVVHETAEGPLQVNVDPDQIQHVILNLVVNAADAIERHGRITLRLDRVADEEAEAYVRLTVEDNGVGMSEESLQHLFEPFFTTKPKGKGTGLGLPMVYGIAKQSHGHVRVDSELGTGTTFEVLLPSCDKEEPQEPEKPDPSPGREGGKPRTVLLVEDDGALRNATAEILRRLGHRPVVAANGQEALDRLAAGEEPVEVVVSDLVMPDLDGVALLERLHDEHPDLSVILVSGHSTEDLGPNVREKAKSFLEKPYTPEELDQAITDAAT